MMLIRLTAVLLALALPFQGTLQAQTSVEQADGIHARALELARILNSERIILGEENSDQRLLDFLQQLMTSDPDILELEAQYPGLIQEMGRAALPTISRYSRQRLPELWSRQAELYTQHFNLLELEALIDFYNSSTAQKLIDAMINNFEPRAILDEATQSEDFTFSAESALEDNRESIQAAMPEFNAEDRTRLMLFVQSGLREKVDNMALETQQIAIDWMLESVPEEEEEIDTLMEQVITNRLSESDQ